MNEKCKSSYYTTYENISELSWIYIKFFTQSKIRFDFILKFSIEVLTEAYNNYTFVLVWKTLKPSPGCQEWCSWAQTGSHTGNAPHSLVLSDFHTLWQCKKDLLYTNLP